MNGKPIYTASGTHKIVCREGIFVGYRGYEHSHIEPQYLFDYGQSYTSFSFSHLSRTSDGAGKYHVSFDVKNTGQRSGATVAQLYVKQAAPTIPRPEKELKGFERVMLQPGETKHLTIELSPRSFQLF
jgi:beta-glucosidase